MDFFNKAKQAASGGDNNSNNKSKSKNDSTFGKAMDAAEKYHAKDKATEYAQKRVTKRQAEKQQPGYVDKTDKSTVDKAMEAAEDFLAKQGQTKPQHTTEKKTKDNQMEDRFGKAKGFLGNKH